MIQNNNAKVTLVGAGPGDPDLISIAGVKALQQAKVVLYDALVNKEILKWAPDAIKIFVGKRLGYKRYEQSEINYLLLTNAMEHGAVVRLKGGDPFVFGRGGEEVDYLAAFNIETKIIPGISSSTSALGVIGAPLTKRGVADSFWVLTATKEFELFAKDIELACQSTATVIILMGTKKLSQIVRLYKENNKAQLPMAIIQSAYCKDQQYVLGTVSTIEAEVAKKNIKNPAVIVIGKVVEECSEWKELVAQAITNKIS